MAELETASTVNIPDNGVIVIIDGKRHLPDEYCADRIRGWARATIEGDAQEARWKAGAARRAAARERYRRNKENRAKQVSQKK